MRRIGLIRAVGVACGIAVVLWVVKGVDRTVGPGGDGDGATAAVPMVSGSPAESVVVLQRLHRARDYDGLARCIVADVRGRTVAFLRAADAVIDANARLLAAAERQYDGPMGGTWSLGSMGNNLGPFSEDVSVFGQRIRGDVATVTLQEGRNVPLVRARFEQVEGRWLFRPEMSPDGMDLELLSLAATLDDIRGAVEGGSPVEEYVDAFLYRVLPQMERVVTVGEAGIRGGVASAGSDEG